MHDALTVQHAACSIQHPASSMLHAACCMLHAMLHAMLHPACSILQLRGALALVQLVSATELPSLALVCNRAGTKSCRQV